MAEIERETGEVAYGLCLGKRADPRPVLDNLYRAVNADSSTLRRGGPVFDLVAAKLRRPATRSGTIRRSSLIEELEHARIGPVAAIVAPAGYGKTTLLGQWAEDGTRPFAWVQVDERDNDPKVLLTYIAEALDAVEPISRHVFEALASIESSVPGAVVPRLASAFASMSSPVVLVLDDVHLLRDLECRSAVSVLADHVPPDSLLVLAGRDRPPIRVARLRAEGKLLEVGPSDLALTEHEAALLLREAEVPLAADEVAVLHEKSEGWAAGLYLAALAIRAGSAPATVAPLGGADVFIAEYFESEFLGRISPEQRTFLTRTAVLERMCGGLCDSALELHGAGVALAELARSNMLVVPLDREGRWYRYHHFFRDMLLAELERQEPTMPPMIQRRAAEWCLENGLPEEALEYFISAAEVDRVANLVEEHWLQVLMQGRDTTLQRWIQWLDDRDGAEGHPMVAIGAAISSAAMGRPAEADRWAERVERWQSGSESQSAEPVTQAWAKILGAELCRHGIEKMRSDADEATDVFQAAQHPLIPLSMLLQGIARVLSGDLDGGDTYLKDSVAAGRHFGGPHYPIAVAERALLALARGQWQEAELLAEDARTVLREGGMEDSTLAAPLVCAVQARVKMRRGDAQAARQLAVSAQRLRPWLCHTIPFVAAQARVQLTRVYLALGDLAAARVLMSEIDEILMRRPALGNLVDEARGLRDQLATYRRSGVYGPSTLTNAELRLLPLLTTHLTFRQIAQELYVSHNTVRTQSTSIYRKLDATSRAEAITRARTLGLLE